MSLVLSGGPSEESLERIVQIVDGVAAHGLYVCEDFLTPEALNDLVREAETGRSAGLFKRALIGPAKGSSGASRATTTDEIRRDETMWLDESKLRPAQASLFKSLEALKDSFNRNLYLGLQEFEAHLAYYPPGGFYKKHLDQFRDDDARVLSIVLYLNQDWKTGDGGELKIDVSSGEAREPGDGAKTVVVEPRGGTLVCFLSEDFPHEVLESYAPRISLAGWFKRRALSS